MSVNGMVRPKSCPAFPNSGQVNEVIRPRLTCYDLASRQFHYRYCSRRLFNARSHKTSGLHSPSFASSIILVATSSLA
jgi:hypothetical protein